MASWTCPYCDRTFGRTGQSHLCEPTASLAEYLGSWSDPERAIAEAVIAHVESCGPVDVEAADVGLLFRTTRTIVELRPKTDRLELGVIVEREIRSPRVRRCVRASARAVAVRVDLRTPEDVDSFVRDILDEAYATNPG